MGISPSHPGQAGTDDGDVVHDGITAGDHAAQINKSGYKQDEQGSAAD